MVRRGAFSLRGQIRLAIWNKKIDHQRSTEQTKIQTAESDFYLILRKTPVVRKQVSACWSATLIGHTVMKYFIIYCDRTKMQTPYSTKIRDNCLTQLLNFYAQNEAIRQKLWFLTNKNLPCTMAFVGYVLQYKRFSHNSTTLRNCFISGLRKTGEGKRNERETWFLPQSKAWEHKFASQNLNLTVLIPKLYSAPAIQSPEITRINRNISRGAEEAYLRSKP